MRGSRFVIRDFSTIPGFHEPKHGISMLIGRNVHLAKKTNTSLFVKKGDISRGLFDFSITGNKGVIELIAVDQRRQRQNVGRSLMRALDSFAEKNAIVEIKVGTQADNVSEAKAIAKIGHRSNV